MPEVEPSEQKQQARKMWAGGEYAEIAERIADAGRTTVEAAEIGSGDKVPTSPAAPATRRSRPRRPQRR